LSHGFYFLSNDHLVDFLAKAQPRGRTAASANVRSGYRLPQHRERGDIVSICPMANSEGETFRPAR
jgi:hypothetical protein